MRIGRWLIVGLGILFIGACDSQDPQTSDTGSTGEAGCDRACLTAFMDQYLVALQSHTADRLPLSDDVRYTENGQDLALDDGLWGTVTAGPDYRLDFADPETGQVGAFVKVQESGMPAIIATRLRVEGQLISEIETIVARATERIWNPEGLTMPHSVFLETVPEDDRLPREKLIDIANSYFEGIEQETGEIVPFHPDCNRVENGLQTTNREPGDPIVPGFDLGAMGCEDQFNTGFWAYITEVTPRRFLMVDEDRQLVFGVFAFQHAGTVERIKVPGVGEVEMPQRLLRPYAALIPELFKIRDGQIRRIEALVVTAPYGMTSGWE